MGLVISIYKTLSQSKRLTPPKQRKEDDYEKYIRWSIE